MKRFFCLVFTCLMAMLVSRAAFASNFLDLPIIGDDYSLYQGWFYNTTSITGSTTHEGIDFYCNLDDPIVAAADGVAMAAYGGGYGNLVRIRHSNGMETLYAHLNSVVSSIPYMGNTSGDRNDTNYSSWTTVSAGDVVGYCGSTQTNTIHLHFELTTSGYGPACGCRVDPFNIKSTVGVYPDDDTTASEVSGHYWGTWPPTYVGPTCTLETRDAYTDPRPMSLTTVSENGSAYDFHQYYVQDREYHLLNIGDMNTATRTYSNPVILAQGSVAYHYQWLNGDVNGDSYDDIVEIQHLSSTQFSEVVWLSNGDGSFQSQVVWQTVTTGLLTSGQNHYFLGDVNNDGKDDVVIGRDEGAEVVIWWQCLSSGSSFNACSYWNGDSERVTAGKFWDNNVFLLGDVTGDGKADLVRGYNTAGQTDPCSTTSTYDLADGYSLRWKVLPGGSSTLSDFWGTNSGCLSSAYLLGDEDGDGKQDLVEVRFEDAKTGHVYVRTSIGTGFNDAESWKNDFGSPNMNYASYDVMGDNSRDALLSHSSGSGQKIKVVRASDQGYFKRGHTYSNEIGITGSGTWLPGHYGDLELLNGTEQVCASSGASTFSYSYTDGTLWDVDGTVYEFWTSDEAWHGYGSSDAFDACGNDWDSIEEVSSSVFSWEPVGSVISNSYECGVTHQNDVYAWNGTVYKISGSGTKQGFTSPGAFLGCGYAWGDLDFLSSEEYSILTTLSDGSAISYVGDCGYAEDLIVREVTTGALVQWTMDGSTVASWSSLGSSSLEWEVVGAGDFNRDGSLDLLWRRLSSPYDLYAWLMDGSTVSSSVLVSSSTDSGWVIRGVFDFTYDGEPDILWKNQSSGALSLWEMNDTSYVSSITVASATSTDWDIRAIGDLTGEGDPDILWRDSVTGALSLWEMDGTSYVSSITIASSSSLDWDVEAIGDYTSDGENDLLWRNPDTGDMAVWEMSGTSYVSFVSMAWSSPAWDLVAAGKMAE